MICPNCRESVGRRERHGHRCSRCGRTFALDPKSEPGRLHDLKFRELVAKGTGGRLRITVEQLYWLNERRLHGFPGPKAHRGHLVIGTVVTAGALAAGSFALGADGQVWLFAAGLGAVVAVREFHTAWRLRAGAPFRPRLSEIRFQYQVIDRWREVYGGLPTGLIEHPPAGPTGGAVEARAVVLCEVPAVAGFLHANNFAERHRVLLADELAQVPAALPVAVLRDLSLSALARTLVIRSALPGRRVVDCGLAPRAVLEPARAVRLRDPSRPRLPAALAAAPGWQRLTDREREWLTAGFRSPLITVPPPKLLALAEKAVERAVAARARTVETAAETRRRAKRIGFLTWPEAARTRPADGAR
ncbi:hypothetical protein [Kitasatospora griseola]|uniref:hypothetical protein n=1 Tax=Kitasatospora griseola TaxID=2064 RepID=UPI0016703B62|nr:hypothetical protein [Kitasatospora griseola]GGQ64279.1 hypothetical protein GCM10010195_19780 [Kitasatospora griseola]